MGNLHKIKVLTFQTQHSEIFHYFKIKNLWKIWEEYVCHWEKWNFQLIGNSAYHRIFGHRKGYENLCRVFDVLPKQTTCELKALQVQVYIQQWFLDLQKRGREEDREGGLHPISHFKFNIMRYSIASKI